jgi:hypothetical protein
VDEFGDVEQRLGGDASSQKAHSARPGIFADQGDLYAKFSGVKGRGVSAGAGTKDCDIDADGIVSRHHFTPTTVVSDQ